MKPLRVRITNSSRAQRTIEPGSDRAGLRYFLLEAAKLPAGQRIPAVDEALAAAGNGDPSASVDRLLDRLYGGTKLADAKERLSMFDESRTQLEGRNDAMLGFAKALRRTLDEKEKRDNEVAGAMMRLRPEYVALLQKLRKGRVYPDANGTLRVSFGTVEGYAPRDPVQYAAQTTLHGVVEKETGQDPFDSPSLLLSASRAKKVGPYVDPDLGDVPVDFLSSGDITNGSSGSATLNASGELAGLAFDGNYEAMGSDYLVNPDVTRTIHVDTRYMLWVMDAIDGAHNLIREMGLPVHFAARDVATRSSAGWPMPTSPPTRWPGSSKPTARLTLSGVSPAESSTGCRRAAAAATCGVAADVPCPSRPTRSSSSMSTRI